MAPASMTWFSLCCTVFALGLRHGLDADHLATIDGLTRFNLHARPALARWCGTLFSLGHGGIVLLVAVTVGGAATRAVIPDWIRDFGAWLSIGFLVLLGLLNLSLVLRTPSDEIVRPIGLRSRLLSKLTRTTHPFAVAGIGALFAVSLDTMSQAVLFSATAARFGGWEKAAGLGAIFTLGMLLVDGMNGAWVAALLKRADRRARMASRVIGLFVAVLSLSVAALGVIQYASPRWGATAEASGLFIGVALVIAVGMGGVLLGSSRRLKWMESRPLKRREARVPQVEGRA